jgi:hypothetical protein
MWTTFDVILMPFSLKANNLDRPSVYSQYYLLKRRYFGIFDMLFEDGSRDQF